MEKEVKIVEPKVGKEPLVAKQIKLQTLTWDCPRGEI
jgi:hypothetical protein